MKRVVFLRHAEPHEGSDPGLTDQGIVQARTAGEAIQAEFVGRLLHIVSSNMRRTVETAECAFPANDYQVDERLTEVQHGFKGSAPRRVLGAAAVLCQVPLRGTATPLFGEESFLDTGRRALEAVREHSQTLHNNTNLVVVSHSFTFAGIMEALRQEKDGRFLYSLRELGSLGFTGVYRVINEAHSMPHAGWRVHSAVALTPSQSSTTRIYSPKTLQSVFSTAHA